MPELQISGTKRFQMTPRVKVDLSPIRVQDHATADVDHATMPSEHKVRFTGNGIKCDPPLSSGGIHASGRVDLLVLNEQVGANSRAIEQNLDRLAHLRTIANQQALATAAAGSVVGAIAGAGARGAAAGAGSGLLVGAAVGAGIGACAGLGYHVFQRRHNAQMTKALNEIKEVIMLYEGILGQNLDGTSVLHHMLDLEARSSGLKKKAALSKDAQTAFRELERILLALRSEEAVNVMLAFAVRRNEMHLDATRGEV